MDSTQTDHLKAYAAVYALLQEKQPVQWLLNYRGGSYLTNNSENARKAMASRGLRYEIMEESEANVLRAKIGADDLQGIAQLERAPKVAVYAPLDKKETFDDAVMNLLNHVGIPYEVIGDFDVLNKDLSKYDWIHLHHEDFTGQYGRFWASSQHTQWYRDMVTAEETEAKKLGFAKVAQMKLAVVKRLKLFIAEGGHLFAMCSATDSYDIALAAEGMDIVPQEIDGDPADAQANSKLKYENCLAFHGFTLDMNPREYEFSNIDTYGTRHRKGVSERNDYFRLPAYSAKNFPAYAMLTQNHVRNVKGFWGMSTGFDKVLIKPGVEILGELKTERMAEARYIAGAHGKGAWCFFAGHDPEDYQHRVGEALPDLSKTPGSPGYRLILNNVLRPAANVQDPASPNGMSLQAWPVPLRGTVLNLAITFSQPAGAAIKTDVRLFNVSGQLAQQYTLMLSGGENMQTLDLPELAAGTYQLEVQAGSEVKRQKIVVEK